MPISRADQLRVQFASSLPWIYTEEVPPWLSVTGGNAIIIGTEIFAGPSSEKVMYAVSQMKGTMSTADSTRFSHITIGQDADGAESSEEEIEFIGAVELVEAPVSCVGTNQDETPALAAEGVSSGQPESRTRDFKPAEQQQAQVDGDEQPMLLARRITLGLCAMGIVAAAVYIMDYWGVISLPF